MRSLPTLSTDAKSLKPSIYEQYKGMRYLVIQVALHSETLEEMVFYQALYGDKAFWVRPVSIFVEPVIVDGKAILRFRYVESAPCDHSRASSR